MSFGPAAVVRLLDLAACAPDGQGGPAGVGLHILFDSAPRQRENAPPDSHSHQSR